MSKNINYNKVTMKKRQITNNEIAGKIDSLGKEMKIGFTHIQSQFQSQINELKTMTNNAFTDVQGQLGDLKSDAQILRSDMTDVKLRLDYHAPKFEVDDLKKRVVRLEKKAGLA